MGNRKGTKILSYDPKIAEEQAEKRRLQAGCVILPNPNLPVEQIYVTRFRVDHMKQSRPLCREVLMNECFPCCISPHSGSHFLWQVWAFIRSEVVLYSLHISVILLGATKEIFDLRHNNPAVDILQTSLETGATLLLIFARMGNAIEGYHDVIKTLRNIQSVNDIEEDKNEHVRKMKFWMIWFLFIGSLLVLISIGALVIFLFYVHLGWTLLSNNFCMITITMLAGLYLLRVNLAVAGIKRDQCKTVLWETILVIQEICLHKETGQHQTGHVKKFVRALSSTEALSDMSRIDRHGE